MADNVADPRDIGSALAAAIARVEEIEARPPDADEFYSGA